VEEQTRSAIARITLPNPEGALRPGMYVDVRFESKITDSAVLVPETAVLRSGDRNTVFIAHDGGTFEPREVTLGARSAGGAYQVLTGLKEDERVVTSGQFMLDSESQLREAIEKMSGASGAAASVTASSTASNATEASHHPEPPAPELLALANATADAAASLAKDDFAGYNQQRETVNNALSAWLAGGAGTSSSANPMPGGPLSADARDHIRALPAAADLKSARDSFEPFSTAVTDLARAAHLEHTAGLHAFECPMAPSAGKARWLQRTSGTNNPFFGSAMPDCGTELK
jgi:hypothetical protein